VCTAAYKKGFQCVVHPFIMKSMKESLSWEFTVTIKEKRFQRSNCINTGERIEPLRLKLSSIVFLYLRFFSQFLNSFYTREMLNQVSLFWILPCFDKTVSGITT
jgi:hypothetical protein